MQDSSVTFIGLGAMGAPMASSVLRSGVALTVYNRSRERAAPLAAAGAKVADSAAAAVTLGGVVITMLANDAALLDVTPGDAGFADRLGAGGLHISMSTVSPETSRHLAAEHAKRGSLWLSAPVFGRPEAAAAQKRGFASPALPMPRRAPSHCSRPWARPSTTLAMSREPPMS